MPTPALHQTSASELEILNSQHPDAQDEEDDLFVGRNRTERDNFSGSVGYNCLREMRRPKHLSRQANYWSPLF